MRHLSTMALRIMTLMLFAAALAGFAQAQSGACTEDAIKQNKTTVADDVFMYMTPYGKPVIGKAATGGMNKEKFEKEYEGSSNMKHTWVGEHRIIVAPAGDMAYEAGTMEMSYDQKGKSHSFQAVMLMVYQSKGGACQLVAQTMEPLEDKAKEKNAK